MLRNPNRIAVAEMKELKKVLEAKLREALGTSRERGDLCIEYLADPLDQVRSSTERDMAVQRLNQQADLIHNVKSALSKIEYGEYGICEACEEPIPRRRLSAVPWARLCVPCQSKAESETAPLTLPFQDAA